jgi:hypothetical protein
LFPHGQNCGIINMMQMKTVQMTATVPIGRDHLPRFHRPALNESPARNRRNVGRTYAMYSPITAIDVTAK